MSLSPGTRLGPYEIAAQLGAGGMGEVYRARDTRLDREVAIKVLPEGFAQNEQLRARFEREAKSISSLNHPNICTLHDVGHQAGIHFLVMELLDGESLADRLGKGALPSEQVLRYGAQIAEALHHAHKHGIVHRDLKPGNVVLTKNGAKLLDFGLARTAAEAPPVIQGLTSHPTQAKPLTQEGMILGTFQYMAPEQLEGQEADERTDLFALGALLYEMATGRKAFEGKSRTSLIAAIVASQPPPLSSIQPMTPPALEHVVRKCLEKSPDDRWQSAHDVAGELRWILEAGSQAGVAAPAAARRRSQWRIVWGLAGVLMAAALAAAWVAGFQLRPASDNFVTRSAIPAPDGKHFDLGVEHSGALTVSPDGRYLTFTLGFPGGDDMLWLRPLDSLTARPLPGTKGADWPFWSPDSRSIAFFAEGKLKKIDLVGSPAVTVCEAADGRGGTWSREGVILFAPNTTAPIHQVQASGGTPTPVTKVDEERGETTHRWASFLPDGRHFLYMSGTHGAGIKSEANAVYLEELGSEKRTLLLQARSNVIYASGYLLYVRDRILLAQAFDLRRLELSGDPIPLAEAVSYDTAYFRGVFGVSEAGVLAYSTGAADLDTARLLWLDRAGKVLSQVGEEGAYRALSLSPDGNKVAYELLDSDSGTSDIWVMDLARAGRTRLTFGARSDLNPIWSPDGERVVYEASGKYNDLFVKPAGGGNEEELLRSEQDKTPTDWSLDGRFVAFDANDSSGTRWDLWILPLTGERKPFAYLSTPFEEREGRFSPDGKWMTYISDESGRKEVYVAPLPATGAKWQVSTGGGFTSLWRRDGREILYMTQDLNLMSVDVQPQGSRLELGTPKPLFTVAGGVGGAVAPGGQKFLVAVRPHFEQDLPIVLVTNWTATLPPQ